MRFSLGRIAIGIGMGILVTPHSSALTSDMVRLDAISVMIDGSLGLLCGVVPLYVIRRRSWPVALLYCWLCIGTALALGPLSALVVGILGSAMGMLIPAPARHSPRTPISPRTIFIYADGRKRGPYTRAEVINLWELGALDETTLYWEPGLDDWRTLAVGIVAMRN